MIFRPKIILTILSVLSFLISFTITLQLTNHSSPLPDTVSVFISETGSVERIDFEKYVAGVIACEMPASFETEALKAQAVAARTYAFSRIQQKKNPDAHPASPLCNTTHCQVYLSKTNLLKRHGSTWIKQSWPKIQTATSATGNELLYYNHQPVKYPLYHASSGGKTENNEDVFVSAVPYLKSVESPYDAGYDRNGHGVGMSQYGANEMASAGYDYKAILSYYYCGTEVH